MLSSLPPREREIVDILYERGASTVIEIGEALHAAWIAAPDKILVAGALLIGYAVFLIVLAKIFLWLLLAVAPIFPRHLYLLLRIRTTDRPRGRRRRAL